MHTNIAHFSLPTLQVLLNASLLSVGSRGQTCRSQTPAGSAKSGDPSPPCSAALRCVGRLDCLMCDNQDRPCS